jgi:hypothetical protein
MRYIRKLYCMELDTRSPLEIRTALSPYGFTDIPRNEGLSNDRLIQLIKEYEPIVWGSSRWDIQDPEISAKELHTAFWGKCGTFSGDMVDQLTEFASVEGMLVTSAHPNPHFHVYVVLGTNENAVIIDPSIGQYFLGYRKSFLGTRTELRNLVVNPETELQPGLPTDALGRAQLFIEIWGNYSHELRTRKTLLEDEYNNSLQGSRLPPSP